MALLASPVQLRSAVSIVKSVESETVPTPVELEPFGGTSCAPVNVDIVKQVGVGVGVGVLVGVEVGVGVAPTGSGANATPRNAVLVAVVESKVGIAVGATLYPVASTKLTSCETPEAVLVAKSVTVPAFTLPVNP